MRLMTSLLITAIAAQAVADDTEVYTGTGSGADANILLVMDTSKSTSILANSQEVEDYDPDIIYDDGRYGFDPDALYLYHAPLYHLVDYPNANEVLAFYFDPTAAYFVKHYEVWSDWDTNPIVSCDMSKAVQHAFNPYSAG